MSPVLFGGNETWGEDEITCPWCGYRHEDSWQIADPDDDGTCECEQCEHRFTWHADRTITYSTERIEDQK